MKYRDMLLVAALALTVTGAPLISYGDDADDAPKKPMTIKERQAALANAQKKPEAAPKAPQTRNIAKCVKKAEEEASVDVPEYVEFYCKFNEDHKLHPEMKEHLETQEIWHKVSEEDREAGAEEIHERIHKRYKAILAQHKDQPIEEQCNALMKELKDSKKWQERRQKKIEEAKAAQQELVAEFKSKEASLSGDKLEEWEAKLAAEGIVLNEDKSIKILPIKVTDLKSWTDVNPANVDAFEWGMRYIERCRKDPDGFFKAQKKAAANVAK